LALDLDRSPRLETCIRSHIVRALVVGSGHKLDLHVGFFSKCCTLSIVAAVCSRPRPLDNNKTKSRRSSDAPFLPSAKGNSPQLKQRLQILFCSLPITQSGPLSPLHATDEPRANQERVGTGESWRWPALFALSHKCKCTARLQNFPQGLNFITRPRPLELWGSHFKSSEGKGLRPSLSLLRPRIAKVLHSKGELRARLHCEAVGEPKSLDSLIQ
jgi:hypothetical protein